MKSKLNFKIRKNDGPEYDMDDLGIWIESFHIYSPNLQRNKITAPGMPGSHLGDTREGERRVNIGLHIETDNIVQLEDIKNIIYNVFYSKEELTIVRDLFPDREIKVIQESDYDINNITESDGVFNLTLTMLDPYAYGQERTHTLAADTVLIENPGTAEADPVFEMEVLEPVTFAMVSNGEEYNMIGQPADDDVEAVDTRETVLYENGSTIDDWQSASIDMVDINIDSIDGVMGTDGGGIRPSNYGTPRNGQRGAAVTKELDESIQDFELETSFDIQSRNDIENWRMVVYLYDENMNNIGHIGLKDNSRNYKRRAPLGRVGGWHDHDRNGYQVLGDSSWFNDNARETTLFYLRMKREGQRFSFYIGEWQSFRHINVWEGSYNDINNQWQGRVKFVTLFIGVYQDRPIPSRVRMNSVELFELKTVVEDQTSYIARPGDIITFDHTTEDILLNGEDLTRRKDFGGSYFQLQKGNNEIAVLPALSFNTDLRYRPRYR